MKSIYSQLQPFFVGREEFLAKISLPIEDIVVSEDVVTNAKEYIANLSCKGKYFLVSDDNGFLVLGQKIAKDLSLKTDAKFIYKNGVKPDLKIIKRLAKKIAACDILIAVGSGTINDIAKYASYLADKKYIIFGTAPSMNGYLSANASIIIEGLKQSVSASLPYAAFFDLNILANSPMRLIRSGVGDSLCRGTAMRDWYLSHLVFNSYYSNVPFELLLPIEGDLFAAIDGIYSKDKEAIKLLILTLLLSGVGMYVANGSYPASQGEHMIGHLIDMFYGKKLICDYHGEVIGCTTLYMANLQERLLQKPLKIVQSEFDFDRMERFLGSQNAKFCENEYKKKYLLADKIAEKNEFFSKNQEKLNGQFLLMSKNAKELRRVLAHIFAPVKNSDLGLSDSEFFNVIKCSKYSRSRFTFLDLE